MITTPTDPMPNLAGIAEAGQGEAATTWARAYLIGCLDRQADEVTRQVAALRTIEDVRALADKAGQDHRAGTVDRGEFHRLPNLRDAAARRSAAAVRVEGRADWCNAHHFGYGDQPEEDVNLHRHHVEGDGWEVELEEGAFDRAGAVWWVDEGGNDSALSEARAYALAVLTACDAVERAGGGSLATP